jgi:hypothetical protein
LVYFPRKQIKRLPRKNKRCKKRKKEARLIAIDKIKKNECSRDQKGHRKKEKGKENMLSKFK